MSTNTVDPAQPTPSTVVVATDGSVTVTQVSNATTVTYPGVFVPETVPAQVGTVTPTAGDAQVGLSWSAPDDGGSAITDYSVQYSTDDATWSTFAHGTTATTATVTGLTNDTLYYFRVAAINAIGTGAYSASVTATPEAPFSPLDLSPTLWLDASDTGTITESGGAVSQWDDKSGNGYDVTQATGSYQPTTGTRTLNGLNVLDFQNDNMENATIATSNQFVVFMVSDDDAISGTARYHIRGLTAVSPIVGVIGGTQYRLYQGTVLDQGTAATGVKLWRAVFDTTDTLHVDGVSQISGSGGTLTTTGLRIGTSSGSTYAIFGAMAEIIVVDGTLTAQQISDTETYLADKWGITL